jgi:serine/threonine protein phosphatase PrpC
MAVVADGMGGLSGGALAAEQVIRTAKQAFDAFSPHTDDIGKMLTTIAQDADTVIKLTAISSEKKPHSTMVILVLTPERKAIWAHVGDSRLYRFDGPNCAERTIDHSYVESLVQSGKLSCEEAQRHPMANVLLNALGSQDKLPQVTIGHYEGLKTGDAFLLCSDGIWHDVSEVEMGAAIAMNSPRQAAEMLINKARARVSGGTGDNCTVAIVKLVELPREEKSYSASSIKRAV